MSRHALIIGNGLAGPLLAVLLAQRDWRVSLFERRADPRAAGYAGGRSINLALSARGLAALAEAGLEPLVRRRDVIPMRGRMIHPARGPLTFQPYSADPNDAINSVSRGGLNLTLLGAAAALPGVELHFEHACIDADLGAPAATFQRPDGSTVRAEADLVIGADGAYSALRAVFQRSDRFDYSQTYLGHGYKELHIPPAGDGFALEPNALHIWPRGGAMMIALPNRDYSFTCTLFWPWEGEHSFAALRSDEEVREFFARHYADAAALMPTLVPDYARNPTSSLVTIRCRPWQREGRAVLIGDAAHAIVPFYGQGMNAAFEDCTALARCLDAHRDRRDALAAFESERRPNADAIADMALENFVEMRDKTGRPEFLDRKRIEQTLHAAFPQRVSPQYNLVSFSTVPYVEARRRGSELEVVIDAVAAALPPGSVERLGEEAWRARVLEVGDAALTKAGAAGGAAARGDGPRLIDISPPLSDRLAVWPGDTALSREVLLDTEKGDNITLSTLRATVHLGSHADASSHYGTAAEGASPIESRPLAHYIGPCRVLEARVARGERIRPAQVVGLGELTESRVLLKTGAFPDPEQWNEDFAALSVELVEHLASRGVTTIGIDTPSVDLFHSKDLEAHRAILRYDISILEGLVLRDVPPGRYELLAQPLRLVGFDASPVRAVLRG